PVNYDNATGSGGWWYSVGWATDFAGTIPYNSNVYPSLSGVVIPSLLEFAKRTGDTRWSNLADMAFESLVRDAAHPLGGLTGSKEINQAGRGVWLMTGLRQSR